jgi:hypothetical protein
MKVESCRNLRCKFVAGIPWLDLIWNKTAKGDECNDSITMSAPRPELPTTPEVA